MSAIQRINQKNIAMPIMKCESVVSKAKKKGYKARVGSFFTAYTITVENNITTFRLKTMVTYN